MYEKETQFIIDFNINKIENLGKFFTFEKLINLELHPAIIKFITGELDYRIYQDRKILLENSAFDYSGIKIGEYFNQISREIRKTIKLPSEQVKDLIINAVVFNVRYLLHPAEEITNLVYKSSNEPKSVSEIRAYLNYIYYYDYLRDILNSYLTKRKFKSFIPKEFKSVIDKISEEVLLQKKEEVIDDAIDSIADFFNDGAVNKRAIAIKLVEEYMKKNNLSEQCLKLNKVYEDSKKKVDVSELKEVLVSPVVDSDLVEDNEERTEEKSPRVEIEFEEENEIDSEITEIKAGTDKSKIDRDIIEEEIIEDDTVPAEARIEFEKDLISFLSSKEIDRITGAIFNDDGEDFTNTMERIAECRNYEEASEILKALFSSYKIDPYLKEAVSLTNAVSDYFSQTD
jgi:hypothetical protein